MKNPSTTSYQLAAAGIELQNSRLNTIIDFNKTFSPLFRDISGFDEDLYIDYLPSWKDISSIEEITAKLESKTDTDFVLGTTTTGPHRDNFKYSHLSRDFAKIASTGQIRLISLILRVSQSIFSFEKTKQKPILLLDDVLLELDTKRRKKFLEFLPEYEQIFFTFLPGEHFNEYKRDDTAILNVNNGVISRA